MADDKDILAEAKEAFTLCVDHDAENRVEAVEDIRFARLGEQWPAAVRKQRELDGRPCLTINRLPTFIRQVVNDVRQNEPSIIVHPADSDADPKTAEILNGLLRNIEATSSADTAYDTALECAVTSGWGWLKVNTCYSDDDSFDQDIIIERVSNPFSIYGDPYSFAADSSDWNLAFEVDWLTKDQFGKQYKGADAVDWESLGYGGLDSQWMEGEKVLLANYWTREEVPRNILLLSNGEIVGEDVYAPNKEMFDALGVTVVGDPRTVRSHKVTQRVMSGAEVLETIPWAGKYIPIIPVYGEDINLEGRRYLRSMVRDARDPQRMFNYWRTASTELVALAPKAPFVGPKGAFATDFDKWTTANTDTHSFIEYDGAIPPQRQPFAGPPAGALQEALNASDDMKSILGLYDASLGAKSNETSGRAIMARQREGDVSTFHFSDNLSRAIRHVGRVIVDLIPHVYNAPRIVRVLGIDGTPQTVQVNQSTTEQVQGQDGTAQEIARLYDLTVGKYDVTVETGPSFTTQREEAANQMMELLRAFPQAAPVIGDLLAKNLDWPGADEIAQRLQQLQQHMLGQAQQQPPGGPQGAPQQGPDPKVAIQSAGLQQQASEAEIDAKLRAEALKIDAYRAETERMAMQRRGVSDAD